MWRANAGRKSNGGWGMRECVCVGGWGWMWRVRKAV